MNSIFVN